jgi:hypothetical protein
MKFDLRVREGLDGFVVHVKQSRNPNHILLTTACSLVGLYFFWHTPQPRIMQVLVACVIVLVFAIDLASKWRGTDVELCVTRLDLISRGRYRGDQFEDKPIDPRCVVGPVYEEGEFQRIRDAILLSLVLPVNE